MTEPERPTPERDRVHFVAGDQRATGFLDTTRTPAVPLVDQVRHAAADLPAGAILAIYTTLSDAQITASCEDSNLEHLKAIPTSAGGTTHIVRLREPADDDNDRRAAGPTTARTNPTTPPQPVRPKPPLARQKLGGRALWSVG